MIEKNLCECCNEREATETVRGFARARYRGEGLHGAAFAWKCIERAGKGDEAIALVMDRIRVRREAASGDIQIGADGNPVTLGSEHLRAAILERLTPKFYGTQPAVLPETLPAGTRNNFGQVAKTWLELRAYDRPIAQYWGLWVEQESEAWSGASEIDWSTVPIQKAKRACPSTLEDGSLCCHDAGHEGHHEHQATGNRIGWVDDLTPYRRKMVVAICAHDSPKAIADNVTAIRQLFEGTTNALQINWAHVVAEKLKDAVTAGYLIPCAWCQKFACRDIGSYCYAYLKCLAERVALSANDCPEERESVVRWCEAQRAYAWPLLPESEPVICSECPAQLDGLTTYQNKHGEKLCVYCYNRTHEIGDVAVSTDKQRGQDEARARMVVADEREKPRPTADSKMLALPHPWESWSTSGAES